MNDFQTKTPLETAVEIVGLGKLAVACGIRYQSLSRWIQWKRLPYTELSGETRYAERIELATSGQVSAETLLDWSFPNRICKCSEDDSQYSNSTTL
jgi:DNA-binding transcriptional regulator YdaS (Cro superfamily)